MACATMPTRPRRWTCLLLPNPIPPVMACATMSTRPRRWTCLLLPNPIPPGDGVRFLLLLALVAALSVCALLLLQAEPVGAQAPQPTLYLVGDYQSQDRRWADSRYQIKRFTHGGVECYVTEPYDSRAGVGISCPRKEVTP
jgi:hypothetical protein